MFALSAFTILLALFGLVFLVASLGSFFTVQTAQVAVVTRFGKFKGVAQAGLSACLQMNTALRLGFEA